MLWIARDFELILFFGSILHYVAVASESRSPEVLRVPPSFHIIINKCGLFIYVVLTARVVGLIVFLLNSHFALMTHSQRVS